MHPKARWFVDAVHREMPQIRVQSWLGDVVAPAKRPGLELDQQAVRDRITASSEQVLDLGLDGVHFDLEPVHSGSDGFLALENTSADVDLLMGLPAYWDNDPSHWAHAETVAAAVRGARLGLEREAPDRQSFGLALYVDFTATDDHWEAYRDGWCASSG